MQLFIRKFFLIAVYFAHSIFGYADSSLQPAGLTYDTFKTSWEQMLNSHDLRGILFLMNVINAICL